MISDDLESVLERMREYVARARHAGECGDFEEAYRSIYRASGVITSVFGDDSLILDADGPFDVVMREYLRVDALICTYATSEAGVARIEQRLAARAGGNKAGNERLWWVHDGALPEELPRETAIWLACRGLAAINVRERFTRGKWVDGRTVRGIVLIHGPKWLHTWLTQRAPESTGMAYRSDDAAVDSYVPDLWRDDRENRYHHLPHVMRAARALAGAGRERRERT
jgi:hypothetical protein